MLGLLLALLSQLPGVIGFFFKSRSDILNTRAQADLEIELARIGMSAEIAKAQMAEEGIIVQSTSSSFKYVTFFLWFGPFILGMFAPTYAKIIFANLMLMPEWYVQSCMLIMFTIWGISVSSPVIGNIFNGLGNYFAATRTHKLELAKVNRDAFYTSLRSVKGIVTPADFKIDEAVFDSLDKKMSLPDSPTGN